MVAARRRTTARKNPEPATVRIRVRVSFNGMYAGEESEVPHNRTVRGWIAAHYVEVISAQGEARSSGSDTDDPTGEPKRAAGGE